MKKIHLLVIGLFILLFPSVVSADSAKITVSAANTVVLGNNVTVTVTISSTGSAKLGAWQFDLSYDKNYLQWVKKETDLSTAVADYTTSAAGVSSKKYTYVFKTLKKGSARISVDSYEAYAIDDSKMTVTSSSKTINIKTQEEIEASYSANAYLKSLKVGDYNLSPEFKKDVYEYTIDVENEIENITISATKEDGNATVSGTGEKALAEGSNKFEIVVTAQKGNNLKYVVTVNRKELDPISVTVDNKDFTIVRKSDGLPEYSTFTPTTVNYGEDEIPALYSEITDTTIIGLKDEEGNVITYVYKDNKLTIPYIELNNTSLSLTPLELKESDEFKDYEIKELELNGTTIKTYALKGNKTFVIMYAQDTATGEMNYYTYSLEDNTFQVYDNSLSKFYETRMNNYKYVLIGLAAIILILILILFLRKPHKKKKDKRTYVEEMTEEEND